MKRHWLNRWVLSPMLWSFYALTSASRSKPTTVHRTLACMWIGGVIAFLILLLTGHIVMGVILGIGLAVVVLIAGYGLASASMRRLQGSSEERTKA